MRFRFKLVLLLIAPFSTMVPIKAQSFVPNSGFENYIVCPIGFSEFTGKISNWLNPNTATPDYMNACANPNPAGMPKNGIGYQLSHGGNAYAGIYTFSGTSYREFIQVQLITPLLAGHIYYLSMYVVLHNKSQTAIDDLGAYISITAPTTTGMGMLPGLPVPQISNPYGSVITDTLNWTLIEGTYIAVGGEKFLTLGHFKNDVSTTYLSLPYGTVGAYYYIDDVNLIDITLLPITFIDFSGTLQNNNLKKNILLKWSTSDEINNCCFNIEKSSDAITFSTIGILDADTVASVIHHYEFIDLNPLNGNNYYRLKQSDKNGAFTYSNTISINNNEACDNIEISIDQNLLHINTWCNKAGEVAIFNLLGQKIISYQLTEGDNTFGIPIVLKGIVLLTFTDVVSNTTIFTKKVLIQ